MSLSPSSKCSAPSSFLTTILCNQLDFFCLDFLSHCKSEQLFLILLEAVCFVVLFPLFRFFVRPFSFPIRVSSFSFSVSFSPKNETFSFHISGQIFPSPTKLSYTMMFSSHIVPFLTHCHFDFPLRRGSTTMWAGKMELWPWP